MSWVVSTPKNLILGFESMLKWSEKYIIFTRTCDLGLDYYSQCLKTQKEDEKIADGWNVDFLYYYDIF